VTQEAARLDTCPQGTSFCYWMEQKSRSVEGSVIVFCSTCDKARCKECWKPAVQVEGTDKYRCPDLCKAS